MLDACEWAERGAQLASQGYLATMSSTCSGAGGAGTWVEDPPRSALRLNLSNTAWECAGSRVRALRSSCVHPYRCAWRRRHPLHVLQHVRGRLAKIIRTSNAPSRQPINASCSFAMPCCSADRNAPISPPLLSLARPPCLLVRDGPGVSRLRKGPLKEGNHLGAAITASNA